MTSVAKLELNSITEFQEEIHVPTIDSEGNPEPITSIFYHEFQKSTWYTHILVKIPCHLDDDNYVFKANTTFHYLKYTYIIQAFPSIRIKPEHKDQYKICWPHNVAINAITQARFNVDDDPFGWFDHIWLDEYFQHFMPAGFRELHNINVGNLPFLENWSDELPFYETSLHQPWPYAQDTGCAFPLYFCSKDTSVSHVYEMKTRVADLLRMAKCVTDKNGDKVWVEMKDVDFTVLEGVNSVSKLKRPEMWGCYAYVTDNEVEWNTTCKESEGKVFYINDVVACDQTNTETYGKSAVVDLYCETPCKAIFWVAENVDATDKRNYSNYTTDSTNLYRGWNPIEHVTLKYGKTTRINQMKSLHFERMQSWYHLTSPPAVAGHSVYSLADKCVSIDAEVGLVFSKLRGTRMIFSLKNTDPFQLKHKFYSEEEEYSEAEEFLDSHTSYVDDVESDSKYNSPNFRMRVRLLVMKKLKIEKKGDKYEFTI